jgi:hypothetical protein
LVRDCTQPDASSRPTFHRITKRLQAICPPTEPMKSSHDGDDTGMCVIA